MKDVAYLERTDIESDGKLKDYVGNGKPVLIMAQGDFCGYCKMAKPAYENLAGDINDVVVCTILIDGEESEKEASKFLKIWDPTHRGVPSYLGFDKNGKFKSVHKEGRDTESLRKFVKSL